MSAVQRASHVRVVADGERPAPKKTLAEAIESGDYVEILRAQRRDIVLALPDEKGPAKAALHRQLSLISKEIESLKHATPEGGDSVVAETDDDTWDDSAI